MDQKAPYSHDSIGAPPQYHQNAAGSPPPPVSEIGSSAPHAYNQPQQAYSTPPPQQTGYAYPPPQHPQEAHQQAGYFPAHQQGYQQTGIQQAGYQQTGYQQTPPVQSPPLSEYKTAAGPQQVQQHPPQQQQFQQQPQQVQAVQGGVNFQNATPIASLGRGPAPVDCPACGQRSLTQTSPVVGGYTHAWAAGLCVFTWCLCFLPYVMDSMKNVEHRCGRCGVLLATWHRSGGTEVHMHG